MSNDNKYVMAPGKFIQELKNRGVSESTMRTTCESWFMDTYVKRIVEPFEQDTTGVEFQVGKVYTFEYSDPKYKEELDFYSTIPIMLCIGNRRLKSGKVNPIGINLTFMPPKIRLQYLDLIWKKFGTMIIRDNVIALQKGEDHKLKQLPLFYSINKMIAQNLGWEFAIRSYITDRIKSKPEIITYTDWWKTCMFATKFLEKKDIRAVYYEYKKALDPEYRIGKKDQNIKIKTITIKELKSKLKS